MAVLLVTCATAIAQDQSVRPGINEAFRDPDVADFVERFEVESREIYTHREQIVSSCQVKPGMVVADVGAGTGLFTRLFAKAVGNEGQVYAVDISQNFLDHIDETCRRDGIHNVRTILGTAESTGLPSARVDLVFICDTYHHFEFPYKTMASIRRALKPGGRVIVIDFKRIPGVSSEWVLEHVRAGQEVFEHEITQAGFKRKPAELPVLEENYFMEFELAPVAAPVGTAAGEQE